MWELKFFLVFCFLYFPQSLNRNILIEFESATWRHMCVLFCIYMCVCVCVCVYVCVCSGVNKILFFLYINMICYIYLKFSKKKFYFGIASFDGRLRYKYSQGVGPV